MLLYQHTDVSVNGLHGRFVGIPARPISVPQAKTIDSFLTIRPGQEMRLKNLTDKHAHSLPQRNPDFPCQYSFKNTGQRSPRPACGQGSKSNRASDFCNGCNAVVAVSFEGPDDNSPQPPSGKCSSRSSRAICVEHTETRARS